MNASALPTESSQYFRNVHAADRDRQDFLFEPAPWQVGQGTSLMQSSILGAHVPRCSSPVIAALQIDDNALKGLAHRGCPPQSA